MVQADEEVSIIYTRKISKSKEIASPCSWIWPKETPISEVGSYLSPMVHCLFLEHHKSSRITCTVKMLLEKGIFENNKAHHLKNMKNPFVIYLPVSQVHLMHSNCMLYSVFQETGLLCKKCMCIIWLSWLLMLVKGTLQWLRMVIPLSLSSININHHKLFLLPQYHVTSSNLF